MFVDLGFEKEVFVAGKGERGRISGIRMVRCRIAARFGPFTLKGKRHEKGKPSEAKLVLSINTIRFLLTKGKTKNYNVCVSDTDTI